MSSFPRDLLWVLRELQYRGSSDKTGGFPDAVARYLLIELGLSVDEVDDENRRLWKEFDNNELGRLIDAMHRIRNFASKEGNEYLMRYVITCMATIIQVQESELTDGQSDILNFFQELFDMKPSEFQSAIDHGYDRGVGLIFLANNYLESKRPSNSQKKLEAQSKSDAK